MRSASSYNLKDKECRYHPQETCKQMACPNRWPLPTALRHYFFLGGVNQMLYRLPVFSTGPAIMKRPLRGQIWTPTPNPFFLLRISVCNKVPNGDSYKGEPRRGKSRSHCNLQAFHFLNNENQVFSLRLFLPPTFTHGRSADVGCGGVKLEKAMGARMLN